MINKTRRGAQRALNRHGGPMAVCNDRRNDCDTPRQYDVTRSQILGTRGKNNSYEKLDIYNLIQTPRLVSFMLASIRTCNLYTRQKQIIVIAKPV